MNVKTTPVRDALAARRRAIFAACRQMGIDDDTRRAMLRSVAGVESSTALDLEAAGRILKHLEGLREGRQSRPSRVPAKPRSARTDGQALMSKVQALVLDMGLSWAYAAAVLKRVSADAANGTPGVDRLEWATPEQLRKVVAALSYQQKRRQNRSAN